MSYKPVCFLFGGALCLIFLSVCLPQTAVTEIVPSFDGGFYVLSENRIERYSKECKRLCFFENFDYGAVSDFDCNDFHRNIVLFEESNILMMLDNNLNDIAGPIQMDNTGLYAVSKVCVSMQGGFWCYDKTENKIVRFGTKLEKLFETARLSKFVKADLDGISEVENTLYAFVPNLGVLLFDTYGNYVRTINLPDASKVIAMKRKTLLFDIPEGLVLFNYQKLIYDTIEAKTNRPYFTANQTAVYLYNQDTVEIVSVFE